MKTIIIIGHQNPDTDSIVSSVAFEKLLKKAKKPFLGISNFKTKVAKTGNLNKEARFVLSYFKEKEPPLIKFLAKRDVFLIDHGDYEQSLKDIDKANIVGVLDHHKLGGIKTSLPIFYRAEPLGATSTILAKMFFENNISLDRKTAGLLLAGIISDTLKFISPTTTKEDRQIAEILAKISKENINGLARKMFEAKSDISGVSLDKLVNADYKEFKAGKINFGIGVHETVFSKNLFEIKNKVFNALKKLKEKRKMDLMFFVLIDILKKNSALFIIGEKERNTAEKVFKKKTKDNLIVFSGIVSRKKQILPPIFSFLEKNNAV